MRYAWPSDTEFHRVTLTPSVDECPACFRRLKICDHRFHRFFTFYGPTEMVCRLKTCINPGCHLRMKTISPEEEILLTFPYWLIGWDVFAWIGHRRFARHWSIRQIREELRDQHEIILSDDALEQHVKRYQTMVNARQQDCHLLQQEYRDVENLVLTVDGLQPEKGHETLYVIREYRKKRVWFAESLVSSSLEEVRRFLGRVHEWVRMLDKPIALWISDKQNALVKGIAAEFPGVPHRYCHDHFLRALAKPLLEADSHAKVQMRRKVRGLRDIERKQLAQPEKDGEVVLDYCSAIRGILNDDRGGPLTPPGLRMAEGLQEVKNSLGKNLEEKKGGEAEKAMSRLVGYIDRGLEAVASLQAEVRSMMPLVREVAETLNPENGPKADREQRFEELRSELSEETNHPWKVHAAATMGSFGPGLFAGEGVEDLPRENGDLERWFRLPKGHERRIHGHRHAGIRIVLEGPTLIPVLDAHALHPEPFTAMDLIPYRGERPPQAQTQALNRRKIMRKARSKTKRADLLRELEQRYREGR